MPMIIAHFRILQCSGCRNNGYLISFSDVVFEKFLFNLILFTGGELSSPKLAALQKVLQSDFCSAVREVYEHVYETVDISGSPEIRANATAKVCITFSY